MSGSAKIIGAINLGDLFNDTPDDESMEGYHSTAEIARAAGRCIGTTGAKLKRARDNNSIECAQVMRLGALTWVYKVNL
jgi:hypothetical protein